MSWVDVDGDGWEDLWLSDSGGDISFYQEHSELYRNRGDGTFAPLDLGISLSDMHSNWAGAWGDYDNDGDPDVFLANGGFEDPWHAALYRNDLSTDGRFTETTEDAGILPDVLPWWCASFADYDGDSFLDVVATVQSGPIYLYHNQGDGTFSEEGKAVGLHTFGNDIKNPVWFDYDGDGDTDLFLTARMQGDSGGRPGRVGSALFRNDGAAGFSDETKVLEATGIGLSVFAAAAADFDQDGWEDLYLGRLAMQGYVLRNGGDGTFGALGIEAGIDMALEPDHSENTMGLGVGDVNDDGWPDVIIGTGHPEERHLPIILCNDGVRPVHFHRCSEDFAVGQGASFNHGPAVGDPDHDGDTDIAWALGGSLYWDKLQLTDSTQIPAFYRQYPRTRPQTAVIHLVGTASNRSAIGARIVVEGTEKHYYTIHGNQGFQSQNSDWVPVYLGPNGAATATIHWPSGNDSVVQLTRGDRIAITE